MTSTYNPKSLQVVIGGHIVTGLADGTSVKYKYNNDAVKIKVGTGGAAARALSADLSGKITITLLQTSASNEFLSSLAASDRLLGDGVAPVMIKDVSGSSVATAAQAWVATVPEVSYSDDIETREWVLETGELLIDVGANL
jgi:hypothetical protein